MKPYFITAIAVTAFILGLGYFGEVVIFAAIVPLLFWMFIWLPYRNDGKHPRMVGYRDVDQLRPLSGRDDG